MDEEYQYMNLMQELM